MKIVVLDGYTLNPGDLNWDRLEGMGDLTVYNRTPKDKIIERIEDAKIVFTNKTVLTGEILKKLPLVKFICVLATGYNTVDIDVAKELGMVVTNIPTYGTNSVAQHTFALLLELCNRVGVHDDEVKKGIWSKSEDFCFWKYSLVELAEKTMGIIGMGRIGQASAKIANAFGMKVLAYDAYPNLNLESDTLKFVELDELLRNSDVINLHCPLFESNKGIINKDNIDKMKEGVFILNTSRGPLIVEEDLAEALNSGKIAGAAVDVVSIEPIAMDNPLMKAENCIITPHIAWAPKEARTRLMNIAVDNLQSYLANKPVNVVNNKKI